MQINSKEKRNTRVTGGNVYTSMCVNQTTPTFSTPKNKISRTDYSKRQPLYLRMCFKEVQIPPNAFSPPPPPFADDLASFAHKLPGRHDELAPCPG